MSAAPQAPLVQVEGVSKSFGPKLALQDISFAVPRRADLRPARPQRRRQDDAVPPADGHPARRPTGACSSTGSTRSTTGVEVKRLIGFLPDEPVFYSYLSGREILELSAAMHGLDVAATMERIAPLIARTAAWTTTSTIMPRTIRAA